MRRIATATATAALALGAVVALEGFGGKTSSSGTTTIAAVFDNVAFLHTGQDVKIAGAKVGSVTGLALTQDLKGLVKMSIDARFVPFHADADCVIEPESLIGEKFVQCTPGTPNAPAITGHGGAPPTVPITDTHSPIDPDLALATFNQPTRERLAIFVTELGGALAGRGADLNAAILRANPALQEFDRTLGIVNADRTQLRSLISSSDNVIGQLAGRKQAVTDFIDQAQRVAAVTAAHASTFQQTIKNLPPLLTQARPALAQLTRLANLGTPTIAALGQSAPGLTSVAHQIAPFTSAARPALNHLAAAAGVGEQTIKLATPVIARLQTVAHQTLTAGPLLDQLFTSMRKTGTVEGLLTFVYYAVAATEREDATSHFLPAFTLFSPCSGYTATLSSDGCDARFSSASHQVGADKPQPGASAPKAAAAPTAAASAPAASSAPAAAPRLAAGPTGTPTTPTVAANPRTALPPSVQIGPVKLPLGQLLGPPPAQSTNAPTGQQQPTQPQGALGQLLNYLLK